jgi:hypothetical protein
MWIKVRTYRGYRPSRRSLAAKEDGDARSPCDAWTLRWSPRLRRRPTSTCFDPRRRPVTEAFVHCCNSGIREDRDVAASCRKCRGTGAEPTADFPSSAGPGGCGRGRGPGCRIRNLHPGIGHFITLTYAKGFLIFTFG